MNNDTFTKPADSTLTTAWVMWLDRERASGGFNRDRSQADLGNHRRGLELLARGSRGLADLDRVPMSDLAVEETLLRGRVRDGARNESATTGKKLASDKTVANAVSCVLRIRADLNDVLSQPEFAPKTGKQLQADRGLLGRPWGERLAYEDWPESLREDWERFVAYRTDRHYAGDGAEHRKQHVRESTVRGNQSTLGPLVRFLVNEEGIASLDLTQMTDLARLRQFRAWYFKGREIGGYHQFNNLTVALALISKFLSATGRAYTEHHPASRDPEAHWTKLYEFGRDTKAGGAVDGKLASTTKIGHVTPEELYRLGVKAWDSRPRTKKGHELRRGQVLVRKRSALFFVLAPFMPVRARNWCLMQWNKNLFKRDGAWFIRFRGDELKIGRRGDKVNEYEHQLPEVAGQWIERWRSYLAAEIGPDFEKRVPHVLVAQSPEGLGWQDCSYKAFADGINNASLELSGQPFPPHAIRSVVATNLVNEAGSLEDAQVAADLLGDRLDTVLKTYYKPNRDKLRRNYFDRFTAKVGA